jgi:hypothetical protein
MIIPISKIDAVIALYGRNSFKHCDSNGVVKWKDDHETTEAETSAINSKYEELLAEYTAQEYARKRKAEYDALNQFELISDDANNGTTTHIDAVNAIKTKYPKP